MTTKSIDIENVTVDPLLPPEVVAELLGVTTKTLADWHRTGRHNLPLVKAYGRIGYRIADVQGIILSGLRQSTKNVTVDPLLPPEVVAELLGVTTGTLAVWRCTGRRNLPFIKASGRIRYRSSDVQSFILSGLRQFLKPGEGA